MEVEGASVVRIARKSSIESEPRTLGIHQIQYAREAAENVVNTRSIEDAMSIFTKGLEPVVSSSFAIRSSWHNGNTNYMDTSDHQELECDSGEGDHDLQLPKPCRDVASAPF